MATPCVHWPHGWTHCDYILNGTMMYLADKW
jgi:hypothetical protein